MITFLLFNLKTIMPRKNQLMNINLIKMIKFKILKMKWTLGNHINLISQSKTKKLIRYNQFLKFKEFKNTRNGKI